jgi:hypothetical protein
MKTFLFILAALLIFGCKNSSKSYAIFDYEDFGPQSMAWEIIGMQWWQWDNHGDSDPNSKCDIKVVVYSDVSLKEMKSLFPINKAKKKDFRYMEYHDSIKYLIRNIEKIEQIDEQWAIKLKERLIDTRKRIQQEVKPGN